MNGFDGLMSTLGSPAVWDVAWLWAFKSAAILTVALLLGRLLGRATAALRYRVWAIAFGLVLVLPLADVALPGLPVLPDVRSVWSATGVDRPTVGTSASRTGDERSGRGDAAPANGFEAGAAGVERASTLDVAEVGPAPESGTVAMNDVPAAAGAPSVDLGGTASTNAPAGTSETAVETVSGRRLVAAIWLLGLLAWLGALGVGLRRAHRQFRSGWSPREDIESEAMQIAGQLGLRRPVPVRIGAVDVPATWGWRRPRILLPADAEQWSRERLRRVLVHELAHIKRRDWPLTLVAEMARAVHWYNPLAWAGLSRMRVERERACDDMVLGTGVRPSDYATDLLEVARGATGSFASAPVMALGRGHRLSDRIEDLLDARRRRVERPHSPWVSGGILALIFGSLAVMTVAAGGVPEGELDGAVPGLEEALASEERVPTREDGERADGEVESSQVSDPLPGPLDEPGPDAAGGVGPSDGPAPHGVLDDPDADPWTTLGLEGALHTVSVLPAAAPDPALYVEVPQQAVQVCNWDRGSGRGRSMQTNVDDDGDWKIRWRTPECETEIWVEGEVVFNAAEDGIASMGRNARFEARERQEGIRRRIVAEPRDGTIRYRFWLDGDETEFDASARRWLQTFLPELFRQTTLQAEERVARIFAQGGTQAVLQEVRRMESDHVAARYLELLMNQDGFEPSEVPGVLDVVAERMDSDHYIAGILEAVGGRWGIRPEFEESYVRAVGRLESDHYAHGALLALVREGMSDRMAAEILAASRLIESDHYKADLLTRMAEMGGIGSTDRSAYVEAFGSVESDHYQHSIIMALLHHGTPQPEELTRILALLETMESDHYLSDVLTRIGRDVPLEGPSVAAFLRAARGIESDHYASEVGRVLVNRSDLEPAQIDLVLDIAGGIEGDHGRGELLRALIREQALNAGQRDRYRELVLEIDSRHLQDQLLAELVR